MLLRYSALLSILLVEMTTALCQTQPHFEMLARTPVGPHLLCNTGYTPEQCRCQLASLRKVLDQYQTDRLADWTFVLIRSNDWKDLKLRLGLNPDSPAFTDLAHRQTFLEEALVTPVPGRSAELIQQWSSSIGDLLRLAVTHELGHALCEERNEHRADGYGKLLRAGRKVSCR